ncbi:hypothetical protein VTK73DRAFT_7018 [Phialemonium thermophilum]|uniref:Uncharacterized protein n=1 Tax=Phialemonium thermophilum TaxID=223376 RepID=A0ABR3XTQ9_9PEZI
MKFSAALPLFVAPLVLAKSVDDVYPARRERLAPREHRGKHSTRDVGFAVGANSVVGNSNDIFNLGFRGFGLQENAISEVIILWFNPGGGSATTIVNTVTQTVVAGGGAANTGLVTPPGLTSVAGGNAGNAATVTAAPAASGTVAGTGATHTVTVGGPAAGLSFQPSEISANIGDTVIFTFLSANHTATQSAFDKPCEALAGGMDSGFQPNPNNSVNPPPQVAMQVMVSTPLWFFCKQTGHCGKGMTFSINPTANKTQAMFQAMAIAQNGKGSGSAITGNGNGAAAAAPPPPPPPAASAPADGSITATVGSPSVSATLPVGAASVTDPATGVVSGSGTLNPDGSCSCAVVCGAGSFPAVAQGNGAFGGFGGAIPASMIGAA